MNPDDGKHWWNDWGSLQADISQLWDWAQTARSQGTAAVRAVQRGAAVANASYQADTSGVPWGKLALVGLASVVAVKALRNRR